MLVVGMGIRWVLGAGLKDSGTACLVGWGCCHAVLTEARYLHRPIAGVFLQGRACYCTGGIQLTGAAGLLGGGLKAPV